MRLFQRNFTIVPALATILCISLAIGLTACASTNNDANTSTTTTTVDGVQKTEKPRFLGIFTPYRPDVQQGNFVSKEMMAQLKTGMTQEQVRFMMGTPLLTDMFHADRWDYIFRLQKGNGETLSSRVSIFFKDNRVTRFEGGNLPSEKNYLNLIVGGATSETN